MAKHAQQQGQGYDSSSGSFGDFFNNLGGSGNDLPDYLIVVVIYVVFFLNFSVFQLVVIYFIAMKFVFRF